MKQHLKAVIWPRGAHETPIKGKRNKIQTVYRYSIIGMIVTDVPIPAFEGKNELVLNGPTNTLVEQLVLVKKRKPKIKTGDATDVLLNLNDI